jgi:hypothetical protein
MKYCFAFGVKQAIVGIELMLDGKLANNRVSNVLKGEDNLLRAVSGGIF